MTTSTTRFALVLAAAGLVSSGALASQQYSEGGFYDVLRDVREAPAESAPILAGRMPQSAQAGAQGPIGANMDDDSRADPYRQVHLGGIGGHHTN